MAGALIAIIDDEQDTGNFLGEIARSRGFEASVTTSPEEFVSVCRKRQPALAVVDLVMPGTDGIQVVRQLAEMAHPPSLILVSDCGLRVRKSATAVVTALKLKVVGSLCKPYDIDAVQRLLGEASQVPSSISREDVELAIANDELVLHYQPVFEVADGDVTRVSYLEALVRWNRPEHGPMLPETFLPLINRRATWLDLTQKVLNLALKQMVAWDQLGLSIRMSINLPGELLTDLSLPDLIDAATSRHGIANKRLLLEITETAAMEDTTLGMEIMTRLRLKDFSLRLDDFGTGFSTLQRLYQMPFDQLKIDQSFVSGADRDEEARAIVRVSVDLAHSLALTACAEGVESPAVLDFLREVGCDYAQGFLLCPPGNASAIELKLSRWRSHRARRGDIYLAEGQGDPIAYATG